jgi:hypothetical protein
VSVCPVAVVVLLGGKGVRVSMPFINAFPWVRLTENQHSLRALKYSELRVLWFWVVQIPGIDRFFDPDFFQIPASECSLILIFSNTRIQQFFVSDCF